MDLKKHVGKKIASARKIHGITQVELAEHLGITKAHLGSVERGTKGLHSLDLIFRISRALLVAPSQLFTLSCVDPTIAGNLGDQLRIARQVQKTSKEFQECLERLLKLYAQAPPEQQKEFDTLLQRIERQIVFAEPVTKNRAAGNHREERETTRHCQMAPSRPTGCCTGTIQPRSDV